MAMHAATQTRQRAATIVEILVAVLALALLGTSAITGLLTVNRMVTTSRFATNAQAIAQSAIDRVLTTPFPPDGPRPAELTPGVTTVTNVPIYTDPSTNTVVVTGTVQTTITDVSRPVIAGAPEPPLVQARVDISYFAAGKNRAITLSTVRTAD